MGGLGKRRQIAGWKPNFLVFANHASGGLEIPRRYYSYQWSAWKRLGSQQGILPSLRYCLLADSAQYFVTFRKHYTYMSDFLLK
jgi:hypothetical protein